MSAHPTLQSARRAYDRHAWAQAYTLLRQADGEEGLEAEDVERLATAAFLTGRDDESPELRARAHQAFLERGEAIRAARAAFWLGFELLDRGESSRGGGWIARAKRLVDEAGEECVEAGLLLVPLAVDAVEGGDPASGLERFRQAEEIGRRFDDRELVVLARHGRGRALIALGRIEDGVGLLDEAMAAVEAGEASPVIAGFIYCSVLAACQEISDLRRAHEWTSALSDWCESQPELVPYRGPCLVRRAELMQLHGAWSDAMEETLRACERLASPPGHPAAASAFYRRAELHRLRGDYERAREGYREAAKWSHRPRPGPALLRLAQGRVEAAQAAIRRVLSEARHRDERADILPAYVDIMIEAGELDAARAGVAELRTLADETGAPLERALAAQAEGSILLAEDDARAALEELRTAWVAWEGIEAPYEAARVRVLIGVACRRLGDEDGAAVELDAARWAFEQLGAAPDARRVEGLSRRPGRGGEHGLTPRELEVLRLVATGETNRAVAERLFISERTVERHVSNIFNKLRVSSRAAATAHAHRHGLV